MGFPHPDWKRVDGNRVFMEDKSADNKSPGTGLCGKLEKA
jgi:hypothetical protein